MHIMYVGSVGSGKTYCAVADAIEDIAKDRGDFIITNQPLDCEKLKQYVEKQKNGRLVLDDFVVNDWTDFVDDVVKDGRFGSLVIDEAPLWLDARKWDSLSGEARRKIIEHRKDDLFIVA